MRNADFAKLPPETQHALLLAIQVRNAMEDFHITHLSDDQMAELNPIIRQALLDGIHILKDSDHPAFPDRLSYLINMIPAYWEIPERRVEETRRD